MKPPSKWALTAIATALLITEVSSIPSSFAASPQAHHYITRTASKKAISMKTMKVHVNKVYPVSVTDIKLDADKMALVHKNIMVRPVHNMGKGMSTGTGMGMSGNTGMGSGMGMSASTGTSMGMGDNMGASTHMDLEAKYDAMKGAFVIVGGGKLVPGMTYTVSASWAEISMGHASFAIPDLVKVMQISKNKVELVYDRVVNTMSATAPKNYWIRSNQAMASGIADLGKNDMMMATNGLKSSQVTITEADKSRMKFIMTFKKDVTPGVMYTVIPCSISSYGDQGYVGPNFNSMSMNKFAGNRFSM